MSEPAPSQLSTDRDEELKELPRGLVYAAAYGFGVAVGWFTQRTLLARILLFFGVATGIVLAATWPTFKGGPERLGISEEIISPPLSVKWSVPVCSNCTNHTSVVVDDSYAYAVYNSGFLKAYNVAAGEDEWDFGIDASTYSTPTIEAGKVYFGDFSGKFYARNTSNGSEAWTYNAGADHPVNTSSVTDGTNIYFGAGTGEEATGKIYALNLETGSEVWAAPFDTGTDIGIPAASLTIGGGLVYLGAGTHLYAIDTANGTEEWSYDLASEGEASLYASSAAIVGNRLYIGGNSGKIYVFNKNNGGFLGSEQFVGGIMGTPTIVGGISGTLYIGTTDGYFYSYNLATETINWTQIFSGAIFSSPVYANGYLFVGTDGFYVLDATTGEVVWNYNTGPIGFSTPAIANGLVYILSNSIDAQSARLYAFEPGQVQAAFVKKWIYNTGENTLVNSNLIADSSNNIYVGAQKTMYGSGESGIYSVDANGSFRWKFTPGGVPTPSLTMDNANGVLFYGNGNSKFYGVNTANGNEKCVKDLDAEENERMISPALVIPPQGIVVGGSNLGRIAAFSLSDCNLADSYDTGRHVNLSGPIIANGHVWFNQGMHRLIGFDSNYDKVGEFNLFETGNWQDHRTGADERIPIIIAKNNNTIYAGADEAIYAVDVSTPSSPTVVWKYTLPYSDEFGVHSVVFDSESNTVVGVTHAGTVYGVSASSGNEKWVFHDFACPAIRGSATGGQPIVIQDVVGVVIGPQAVVLSIENGQLRSNFTFNLVKTAPIIVNGVLVMATANGKIVAADMRNYSMDVTASLGGTLSTVYGDFLEILANALSSDTTITLAISNNDQTPPSGTVALPRKYDYGPHGTTFSPNATAKFAYKDSDLQDRPEEDIRVFVWDDVANGWTAYSGTLDTANKKFIVSLTHFSEFMMIAGIPSELDVTVMANQYNYEDKVKIRFEPTEPNLVRDIVARLNEKRVQSREETTLTKTGENLLEVFVFFQDGSWLVHRDTLEVVGGPLPRPEHVKGLEMIKTIILRKFEMSFKIIERMLTRIEKKYPEADTSAVREKLDQARVMLNEGMKEADSIEEARDLEKFIREYYRSEIRAAIKELRKQLRMDKKIEEILEKIRGGIDETERKLKDQEGRYPDFDFSERRGKLGESRVMFEEGELEVFDEDSAKELEEKIKKFLKKEVEEPLEELERESKRGRGEKEEVEEEDEEEIETEEETSPSAEASPGGE